MLRGQGLGFGLQGAGFRVEGFGFSVKSVVWGEKISQSFRFLMSGSGV